MMVLYGICVDDIDDSLILYFWWLCTACIEILDASVSRPLFLASQRRTKISESILKRFSTTAESNLFTVKYAS